MFIILMIIVAVCVVGIARRLINAYQSPHW